MRTRRRQLSSPRQFKDAQQASSHVLAHRKQGYRGQHVGIYQSFDGELGTATLIKRLRRQGARLYVPVINDSGMSFTPLPLCASQKLNQFNILEPGELRARIKPQQLNVVLTPLVAFDRHGNRMGMGAGYYDRCFAFKRHAPARNPVMIGMAHACQEVAFGVLKQQPWDVPLDYMVSEKGLRKCLNRGR